MGKLGGQSNRKTNHIYINLYINHMVITNQKSIIDNSLPKKEWNPNITGQSSNHKGSKQKLSSKIHQRNTNTI